MAGATAFVLGAVGKGILGGAGKKIFDKIFGSGGLSNEELLEIFERSLEDFAEQIKAHVDAAFLKERLLNARRSFRDLLFLYRLFDAAGPSSKSLLDDCVVKGVETLNHLADVGAVSVKYYTFTGAIFVAVYEDRATLLGAPELKALNRILPEIRGAVLSMIEELRRATDARVSTATKTFLGQNGEPIGHRVSIRVDGKEVAGAGFADADLDGLSQFLRQETTKHKVKLQGELDAELKEVFEVLDAWKRKYPDVDQLSVVEKFISSQ